MLEIFPQTYARFARLLPQQPSNMLDVGCGTGLELDEIFRRFPDVRVTGIDITESMLSILKRKHSDKHLDLIVGDFREVPFGVDAFDTVISFEALHHLCQKDKARLYGKIYAALKSGGYYIECDYVAECEEEVELYLEDREKRRTAQKLPEDALLHYDTPFTKQLQEKLLCDAGFRRVVLAHEERATAVFVARK